MKNNFKIHYISIGYNVKEIRLKKGWSQNELAKRCSVNTAKISKIENAREDYMLSTLLEIATALEVSLKDLLEQ